MDGKSSDRTDKRAKPVGVRLIIVDADAYFAYLSPSVPDTQGQKGES